jgi:hypothetical protein
MGVRVLAAVLVSGVLCFADTLTLRNGGVVEGTYLGGDARRVKMAIGDRVESYGVDEIRSIHFGGPGGPPPSAGASTTLPSGLQRRSPEPPPPQPSARYDNPGPAPAPRYDNPGPAPAPRYDNPPPSQYGVVVPAGTALVVRLIDPVDSETDHLGQTYRASIDEPVVDANGQTVIPRGADVIAKLVEDQQSGKIQGRTVLTLDLMQVQVNGRMVDVNTAEVTQASSSRGARSGKVIGGATALGAIIGAIAGGGKGAAVGAASGAAVGTGAQVLTKGQRVRIPSETRLTFTLQQPLQA